MASALSAEILEHQLDQIELLRAMYSAEELIMDDEIDAIVARCRAWCEDPRSSVPTVPEEMCLRLTLPVGDDELKQKQRQLSMDILIPMKSSSTDYEPPTSRVRPVQPSWLTRAQTAQLSSDIPSDDILSAIEHIRERSSLLLSSLSHPSTATLNGTSAPVPLVRVWFYFPSISTRQKRTDLITAAPLYSLTGFLLAGKPGILCLEGRAQDIDDYMTYIKTESWGDIPSQHKKVSERHREMDIQRVFEDMGEITEIIERRGERGNRGDMRALEAWLVERGLEGVVGRVLM